MSVNSKILVGLVEDQLLFREGMKAILASSGKFEVIFESSDGHSVVGKLDELVIKPDVLLVDLSLPQKEGVEFNGGEVTTVVQKHFPDIKIIILSGHNDENFIAQMIELGAHGYLVKDSDPQEVYDAISAVHSKGSYINERALRALQRKSRSRSKPLGQSQELTRREVEILELICKQFTSEEIAEKLFISVKTVNGHRINMLEKTGAKNLAGLVIYAVKNDLVNDL